jgi:hypothetical protein
MPARAPHALDAHALEALGIAASPDVAALAHQRARGVLHHLVAFVRLGRETRMSTDALVQWNLDLAGSFGYYDEWCRTHGAGNLETFVADFVYGRRMLYDDVAVDAFDGGYEVRSHLWFAEEAPESFLYCEVSAEDLRDYVVALGRENARRCGVRLELTHRDGVELAMITREAP